MIGFLRGTIVATSGSGCLIDVGGVGYRLNCSTSTLNALPTGLDARVWTHLNVREDALTLYGFAAESELRMFEALLSVSGVGPKAALGICGALTPESFRRALVTDDLETLSSVPGIGKKSAQRIVLDLKEKLALPDLSVIGESGDALARARSALANLGYSPAEVREALSEVDAADLPVEQVVRSALKVLAG